MEIAENTMLEYICPVCGKKIERDLLAFMDHTEQHIVSEIKKKHPDWEEGDAMCKKCVDYYRRQMKGEGR